MQKVTHCPQAIARLNFPLRRLTVDFVTQDLSVHQATFQKSFGANMEKLCFVTEPQNSDEDPTPLSAAMKIKNLRCFESVLGGKGYYRLF